jgi:DNA ligase 1
MNFSEFASLCYQLEKTPSRLEKIASAAEYLKRLERHEIRYGVAFLSGRPFPVSDPRTLDLGPGAFFEASVIPAGAHACTTPLTITDVAASFAKIAEAAGKGSRREKFARLKELVEKTGAQERLILFRLLHNELRIGLHDGLIQEAIARASGADLKTVRRAALFLSDLAEVASIALTEGVAALRQVDIKLYVPLLPMLSELAQGFDEIFKAHGGKTALEFKYDGARIQIHKERDLVRIWSRRLSEVTRSLPEIAEIAREHLRGDSFILDGEVVAVGRDGRPYPFQELMRRFRRIHGIEPAASEIPLFLYLFDCLLIDGRSLIADRGSGRRRGWLSNYHLAVADGAGGFAPVGKTFKGLTDKEFIEMTTRLKNLATADNGYTVTVKPEVVVEVAYNEIQRSPQYSSGFALRFARITRIREDKGAEQATTLAELQSLYERQFIAKSRREVGQPEV